MQTVRATLVAAAAAVALVVSPPSRLAEENNSKLALTVSVEGAIGPATARYVKDALTKASERHAEIVVLRLNTPGGLSDQHARDYRRRAGVPRSRRRLRRALRSPCGQRRNLYSLRDAYRGHGAGHQSRSSDAGADWRPAAGSAGALPLTRSDKEKKDGGDQQPKTKDAMTAKATNDAVALIRSLAEMRGRNADWAEKAVREAASLSANAALQANVIDLVARDQAELLRQIDGRTVEVAGGETRHLATREAAREAIDPGWISRFLRVITDPNVAFILMLVGIYGLIFELSSPGAVAPGVIGTICLLLGLYALNMLPINYAGLGLILLGITLLVIEVFNPTVVLGLGGVVAFVLGAVMLFELEAPGFRLSWPVIGITAAIFIGLILVVLGSLRRAQRGPIRLGAQAMRGLSAEILDWSESEGHVFAHGERWQARGTEAFKPGEVVEVANIVDLTLVVRRRPVLTAREGGTT